MLSFVLDVRNIEDGDNGRDTKDGKQSFPEDRLAAGFFKRNNINSKRLSSESDSIEY